MRTILTLACGLLGLAAGAALANGGTKPNPEAPPEMAQFQFLVGTWRAKMRSMDAQGEYQESEGTWVGYYTLDGYAFQDDYFAEGFNFRGTTWRTYVPGKKRWVNRWLQANVDNPAGFTAEAFYGEWNDGEMHIEASGSDIRGAYTDRIRFHDIGADAFMWRMSRSYDGGQTWIEDMTIVQATRIK